MCVYIYILHTHYINQKISLVSGHCWLHGKQEENSEVVSAGHFQDDGWYKNTENIKK